MEKNDVVLSCRMPLYKLFMCHYNPRFVYFLHHLTVEKLVLQTICVQKRGNFSFFWSKIHGLKWRVVSNQELVIMARVLYDILSFYLHKLYFRVSIQCLDFNFYFNTMQTCKPFYVMIYNSKTWKRRRFL